MHEFIWSYDMFIDVESFSFFTPIIAHLYAANHPYKFPIPIKTQTNTRVFTSAQSLCNAIKATDATIWEAVQNGDVVAILRRLHDGVLVSGSFHYQNCSLIKKSLRFFAVIMLPSSPKALLNSTSCLTVAGSG